MSGVRVFSPAEAAVLSEIDVKAVHNAMDKRVIASPGPSSGAGSRRLRLLTSADLVRLKLWHGIGSLLPSEERLRLFEKVEARPMDDMVRAADLLIVDVGEARRQVAARTRELDAAVSAIKCVKGVMGGEPVFDGTRIPVRLVTDMLADGASEEEILEGYPRLDVRLLSLAKLWVLAHPRRGRPRKADQHGYRLKSVTRTSLRGAGAGDVPR